MATGYRVFNTQVSGSSLQASLSGHDVRALEFDAANKRSNILTLGLTQSLTTEQWIQASIGRLLIDASVTGPAVLNLGPDAASQASQYISLFDFRSTNECRLVSFVLEDEGQSVLLANSSGSTAVFVGVSSTGSASNSQQLFNPTGAAGATGNAGNAGLLAGLERLVVVSASNLTSGSESVLFNILVGSV